MAASRSEHAPMLVPVEAVAEARRDHLPHAKATRKALAELRAMSPRTEETFVRAHSALDRAG